MTLRARISWFIGPSQKEMLQLQFQHYFKHSYLSIHGLPTGRLVAFTFHKCRKMRAPGERFGESSFKALDQINY